MEKKSKTALYITFFLILVSFNFSYAANGCIIGIADGNPPSGRFYYNYIGNYNGYPQYNWTGNDNVDNLPVSSYCVTITGAEGSCSIRYDKSPYYIVTGKAVTYTSLPCNVPIDTYSYVLVILVGGYSVKLLLESKVHN
ncbi:hypothetical protein [Pedobacter sp. Hv1]|uniref:hypothetical protein n=1 Tax=Pedobacter sp. Hv1 TaxID=1740090 RepID=UPI0006D8B7CF|nr:hypothetical protein [Pedobacter sp. Hv1]KQC01463.1 hypothetical protein AQF98_07080 [Pedobacter sp. Hv1]